MEESLMYLQGFFNNFVMQQITFPASRGLFSFVFLANLKISIVITRFLLYNIHTLIFLKLFNS